MRRTILIVAAFLIITAGLSAVKQVNHNNQVIHLGKIQLQDTEYKLNKLQDQFNALDKKKAQSDQQVQQLNQQRQQLEQQKQDLQNQLQARANLRASKAVVYAASPTVSGCGDNFYANYIYTHESGCSLYNPNPQTGACGLGQAWPCSKLRSACPSMDYTCENNYFNNYAAGLGGWARSYAIWVGKHWW